MSDLVGIHHSPRLIYNCCLLALNLCAYVNSLSYRCFAEMTEFQKIVGTFIELIDGVAKEVEKEKMKVSL